jgi:DNA-binding transcriptional LysR family regulator
MELREIRYFVAVCETLNFTRAADICRVTQPSLTRGIQKLERELGGPLFARERGHTHLTALGRAVRTQLEELIACSDAVERQAEQARRLASADLRLGIMCSIGPSRLAAMVRGFLARKPGVALSMLDAEPAQLVERLLEGELDAALLARPELAEERLNAETLYVERMMVACAPGHRFEAMPDLTMAAMNGETYLVRVNCEQRATLAEALRDAGARINVAVRSEREDWIQSLVAAGLGVCFLPEFSPTIPGLVLRPVTDAPPAREICLVTVAGRRWSPALACFIEAARRNPGGQ